MIHALLRALKRKTNDDDIADVSTLRQFNFEPVIKRRTRKTNDKQ